MQTRIILILVTIGTGFVTGWIVNGWRLESRIAKIEASYAKAYAEAQKAARIKENGLVNDLSNLRRTKDAEIKNINGRLAAALDGLRDRPERIDLSKNTGSCNGSTGAQLARGDAEFLARYAADAARLQSSYKTCVGAYEAARKALE